MVEVLCIFSVSISIPGWDIVLYFCKMFPFEKTRRVHMGSHYFLQLELNLKLPQMKTLKMIKDKNVITNEE